MPATTPTLVRKLTIMARKGVSMRGSTWNVGLPWRSLTCHVAGLPAKGERTVIFMGILLSEKRRPGPPRDRGGRTALGCYLPDLPELALVADLNAAT